MNAFDFIFKGAEKCISYDEAGNVYVDWNVAMSDAISDFIDRFTIPLGMGMFLVKEGVRDMFRQYEVIGDGIKYSDNVRRPYYRMRGKPVTPEQAFDIIRRTDSFMGDIYDIYEHDDFVRSLNFVNLLFNKNYHPCGAGWIHTDGTVGVNSTTDKYPTVREFIYEWLYKLIAFPYLDLAIAVTCWDEIPPAVHDYGYDEPFRRDRMWEWPGYDADFYKAVVIGIHVHDKTVEILNAKDTVRLYKEYAALYGKNWEIFPFDYYEKNNIEQADLGYLKRCIESYGFDADAVLSKTPESFWKRRS